jgi:signal transduction histidine kinase
MLVAMSRLSTQIWGGVFVTLACLTVAVPVAVLHFQGVQVPLIPTGWWFTLFAAFFAAFAAAMWLMDAAPRRVVLGALAAQTVLGPVLVLTAPNAGWVPILLVLTAALSAYAVPMRVSAAIVAVNTVTVAAATALVSTMAFEVGMVAVLYLLLQGASVLGVKAHLREHESRKQVAEANVRLRAASALLAESSRSEERLRIARELHDLVGHQLTVLSLELEVASHRVGGDAAESVERSRALARQLLADVRATVGEMRREGPRLQETLHGIVADLPDPAVHLDIDDAVEADEERTRTLVRCVQEVVTNAIRHADAAHLWIAISVRGDTIVFEARDDGLGARDFAIGNGLRGMAERVEALGGEVRFSGGDGFRVRAEVPAA